MLVRKLMAIALVFSLLSAVNAAAQNTGSVETVKQKVAKFGIGEKARVIVKLENQPQVKGYVSEVGDESFVVTKPQDGTVRSILYSDVIGIKKPGLPLGAKIAIWTGVAFLGVVTVIGIAIAADNS